MRPLLDMIDRLTVQSYRCRLVNRVFGCTLDPAAVAQLLPDEDVHLLAAMDTRRLFDDPTTLLQSLLEHP